MTKQILVKNTTSVLRIVLSTILIIMGILTGLFFHTIYYHNKSIEKFELQIQQFGISITELESKYEKLIQLNKEK